MTILFIREDVIWVNHRLIYCMDPAEHARKNPGQFKNTSKLFKYFGTGGSKFVECH